MKNLYTAFNKRKLKNIEKNASLPGKGRTGKLISFIIILSAAFFPLSLSAQGNFGFGTTTPNASAIVDISSTTQGLLAPRMTTTQRDAITTPATGLLIYNTSVDGFQYFNGTDWVSVVGSLSDAWQLNGNSPSDSWDGTTGSYLGTGNTRPLVLATTDSNTAQPVEIWTGNKERMRILGNGRIAVGKTSASALFDLEQPNTATLGQGSALNIRRDNDGTTVTPDAPVVSIVQNNSADQNKALSVKQSGVPATAIELPAIYGYTNASTSEQSIGVWGDATGGSGTIGVLATGNGSSNVALQVNDGSMAMGRSSTDPTPNGAAVESADAGNDYSANGPSGVIEFTMGASGNLVTSNPDAGVLQDLGTKTINNSYVTSTSIILINVVSKTDDGSGPSPRKAFFMLDVESRGSGSFSLHIGMIPAETIAQNYDGDSIRIGYIVVNPSK